MNSKRRLCVTGEEEEDLPNVSVAVLAEGLVVRCANLGASAPAPARRRTAFCPPTVDTFAWPMDLYDLTSRFAEPLQIARCSGHKSDMR